MAFLKKHLWTLFVLNSLLFCVFPSCDGQNVNSDVLRQLEYDVVDQEQEKTSDIAQAGASANGDLRDGNKIHNEASASIMYDQVGIGDLPTDGAREPLATRKKATCVGCPTDVDIKNPDNLKAIHKLLEEPLALMDAHSQNQYKFTAPNILSVTKQVESGIRYIITFETYRSLCLNEKAEKRNREDCPPQPQDQGQICVIEVIDTYTGSIHSVYNNCTEPEQTPETWKFNQNIYHTDDSNSESMKVVQTIEAMPSNIPENQDLTSDENEERQEDSQGTHDSLEDDAARMSRSDNVGALKDVDKSEFNLVAQFAELAAKTLDEIDPDNTKRVVLGITEAKKQIVNGVMYHLVLQLGTSNCRENVGADTTDCVENQIYPEKVCRVQIHRSWADESPLNAKVVKSECADVWSGDIPYEPLPVERTRRSSQENWPSTEGWKKYDLDDRSQADCLDKVMASFQEVLHVSDVKKVASIRDAHTRINQETNHPEMVVTILLTDPEKLKMMGDVKKPMVVSSRVVCTQRLKRSAGIPGGLSDADVNDPHVIEMANFSMSEIQKSVNSPYLHKLVRIIEAKKQVVAGTLYHLELEVAPTPCLKSDQSAPQSCNLTNSEPLLICTLKVWDQPWTQLRQVQDLNCGSSRSKREALLGGPQIVDVEDPYVKNLASFALLEIDKGLNSPYQQKIVRVEEAKRQVVEGTLMHLKLVLATTNCLKSEKVASENCVFASDQDSTVCSLKVWDREWLKKREIQDLQCGRTPAKRETSEEPHLLGGLQPVNVNNPDVREFAAFALSQMDGGTNSTYQRKIIRITKAEKQVVAGLLMHLTFELGLTSCMKGQINASDCMLANEEKEVCHVKVVDQPWIKKRELLDAQCGNSRRRRTATNKKESFMAVDVNDPYIIESANYAVGELDKGTNSPYRHKLVHVLLAQMEHSTLTSVKLNLEVGYSTCKKLSKSKNCNLLEGADKKICYFEVKHLPWQGNVRYVTHMQCAPSDSRIHSDVHHGNPLVGGDDVDVTAARFRDFMHQFNKTYSSDAELRKRFHIFKANLKAIEQLQAAEQGTAQYGPTIFADLSPDDFKRKYLGLRRDLRQENAIPMRMADIPDIHLPTSFDWRDHNAVTPVKNQGACGSCWAFAVTGNLEGQYAINHGKLLSLSEQELVDCDTLDDGCKGGLPENAYHALEQLGGIETEKDYPYEGDDEQCHFNRGEVRVQVKSSVNITTNESDMAKWLVKNGPIAIGINANAMQFYVGGVSHPFKFLCGPGDLDHGVLIVGYGVHTTSIRHKILPYWLIKNSWGTFWGEKGYYRVYRGDGTCGVNQMASSAVVA